MLGPIDYIVVGIKGNNFDGSVLHEIGKAADKGVIRVVDLLFIIKDKEGNIDFAEVSDQSDDLKELSEMLGHKDDMPMLTEDDVAKIGAQMPDDMTAGVLVIEQLWAKGLKKALMDKDAVLLAEGRIHADKVDAVVEDLKTVPATA
jgi:hypothetical protein